MILVKIIKLKFLEILKKIYEENERLNKLIEDSKINLKDTTVTMDVIRKDMDALNVSVF